MRSIIASAALMLLSAISSQIDVISISACGLLCWLFGIFLAASRFRPSTFIRANISPTTSIGPLSSPSGFRRAIFSVWPRGALRAPRLDGAHRASLRLPSVTSTLKQSLDEAFKMLADAVTRRHGSLLLAHKVIFNAISARPLTVPHAFPELGQWRIPLPPAAMPLPHLAKRLISVLGHGLNVTTEPHDRAAEGDRR